VYEQSDTYCAIERIMDHPSNSGRDAHTRHHLRRVLEKKPFQELQHIEEKLARGESLPDHFE